ncbi:MAG: transporter substrate-binding domain-containing protein [Actinomycetota bacterium]
MVRSMRWRLGTVVTTVAVAGALVLALASGAAAQDDDDPTIAPPAGNVTVVMTELAPFVIKDRDRPDGFYVEIWDEVAKELDVTYDVIWVDSFPALLQALTDGRAEVAVAPLAPTAEREVGHDFSSAVVSSGPVLGYHERISGRVGVLRAVLSWEVLRILAVGVLGLIILGHFIWLAERDVGDGHFRSGYGPGVWDGFWWAAVTVTTVGYGDKAPRSTRGRMVALLGMLLSLFLVGAFVSQITSILEGSRVEAPFADLDGVGARPVAVVEGSTFAAYLEEEGVVTRPYPNQAEVFAAARDGDVDVVVTNPFALQSLGSAHGVSATGGLLYAEFETFGLAQGSPWREPINQVLADLHSDGEVAEIVTRWQD